MLKRFLHSSDEAACEGAFPLKEEDYLEKDCLLCMEDPAMERKIRSIPQKRILDKMDEYMARRDYKGAERHLLYWLEEAKAGADARGELLVCNELIGHYRKMGEKNQALHYAGRALELLKVLDFDRTVSAGTTYVNAATAAHAFGEYERAGELFEQAREIYEAREDTARHLLGGLYNNMALNLAAREQYVQAYSYFQKAMEQMKMVPGGKLEQAITCLNMADALDAEYGMEEKEGEIFALVDQAEELLREPDAPRDGYYAFVCEKCAPAFSYYGYFQTAQDLTDLAEEIYRKERTRE